MKNVFNKGKMLLLFCAISLLTFGQNETKQVPLSHRTNQPSAALNTLLTEKKWNQLFPHRNGLPKKDFYSYKAFMKAASHFPNFVASGKTEVDSRELAAFLANIAHETGGGWEGAPGGRTKWGLMFIEEINNSSPTAYSDFNHKIYPPVKGKSYHGRGPKQLSWNYNYGQFSEAWYGSKDTLLIYPERVATDPVLSFASALWFWMTPQYPKPSCHEIMTNHWNPTPNDIQKKRLPGFGATVNVINGGIECGKNATSQKTNDRFEYYRFFCKYFAVQPGNNISCSCQTPFGQ